MESFRKHIALLKSNTDNQAAIIHLHRSAHSLKGTAAVMELAEISAMAERMETELKATLKAKSYDLPADALRALEEDFHRIEGLLAALKSSPPTP